MANEREKWQGLLVLATARADEFGHSAGIAMQDILDVAKGFVVTAALNRVRALLPTDTDINHVQAQIADDGTLKHMAANMAARVAGAAPRSKVASDVITLATGVGNELAAAERLMELAREKQDMNIVLLAQIQKNCDDAAGFVGLANRKVAVAYTGMVQIRLRIQKALDQIGGV